MTSTTEEALSRFLKSLSAEYDVQSLSLHTQHLMRGGEEITRMRGARTNAFGTFGISPRMRDPECICSLPSFSLETLGINPNRNSNRNSCNSGNENGNTGTSNTNSYYGHTCEDYENENDEEEEEQLGNDNELRDSNEFSSEKVDHEVSQELLSRVTVFRKVDIASSSTLRNIISSFGRLLEHELIARLHTLMNRLDKVKETEAKRQRKEAVYQAFVEQSTSRESPAVPVAARTSFCTIMPVRDWSQVDESREKVTMGIVFECEICLHILPNTPNSPSSLILCHLQAPGEITGLAQSHSGVLECVNTTINMDILYKSIRKECRTASKRIINAIVGFDLLETKDQRRKRPVHGHGHDKRHESDVQRQQQHQHQQRDQQNHYNKRHQQRQYLGRQQSRRSASTFPTVASIDDNSNMSPGSHTSYMKKFHPSSSKMNTTSTMKSKETLSSINSSTTTYTTTTTATNTNTAKTTSTATTTTTATSTLSSKGKDTFVNTPSGVGNEPEFKNGSKKSAQLKRWRRLLSASKKQ